jgi:acyl transferase domain-containing protein
MYEPLAIVGCGMRLPGSVDNGQAFWDFLINKQEARGKIPTERFNIDAFHGPGKPGCISTLFGNFLEHVDLSAFDTSFWPGLPATEVAQLDPQLRLLLEVVHECIENAGAIDLAGKKVGTYVGCFGGVSLKLI